MSQPASGDAPAEKLLDEGLTADVSLTITSPDGTVTEATIDAKAPDADDLAINVRALLQVALDKVTHEGEAHIRTP
jgi:hypothetical protein